MAHNVLYKSVQTRARKGTIVKQSHLASYPPRPKGVGSLRNQTCSRFVKEPLWLRARHVRNSFALGPPNSDGDGNHIHNQILQSLPPNEREIVFDNLEFVRLSTHQVLHETGDTLKSGYFCDSGMISILSVFSDGKSVEVGLVGKEGFLGLPLIAGFRTAGTRATAQIEGTAFLRGLRQAGGDPASVPYSGSETAAIFANHDHGSDPDCSLQSAS